MDLSLRSLPFAVVDVETTGNSPVADSIVELAVVHVDPGSEPELVLDTLVDPQGPCSLADVHGIRREDVQGAPTFGEVAAELWNALAGRVVVAHNAAGCDLAFLAASYHRLGVAFPPLPYLCTLSVERLLGGVEHMPSLDGMAARLGLGRAGRHAAAEDAALTSWILGDQLERLDALGVTSCDDLAKQFPKSRTVASLSLCCLPSVAAPRATRHRSRSGLVGRLDRDRFRSGRDAPLQVEAGTAYAQALVAAFADGAVDLAEMAVLQQLRAGVSERQARALHATVLAGQLMFFAMDGAVDDEEAERIDHACRVLGLLGWSPGV